MFPAAEVSASAANAEAVSEQAAQAAPPPPQSAIRQLEEYLEQQPRVPVAAGGGSGAAVVIVKFNDYMCPPCGLTYREYKPILAKLQKEHPGKIAFVTKDFPLDPECNSLGGSHLASCEAAVAVRLAREKGRADNLEDWLFANQPTLTPERVKEGLSSVAGVTDFDARYAKTLELVRADIAQGLQLEVRGTPTFFMNGIRLPNLRGEFFEAAVQWELRRVGK
jgi:protein-disulfide isomerase